MNKHCYAAPPPEDLPLFSTLLDSIYARNPIAKPHHPTCYEGEWICEHGPCPIRMVRLRVKALHHKNLPRLRCPLCLRTLVFRRWLSIADFV